MSNDDSILVEPTAKEVALKRREIIRHGLTLLTLFKINSCKNEKQAKIILKHFFRDLSKKRTKQRKIETYCFTVYKLKAYLKRILEAHKKQFDVLSDLFDKVKDALVTSFKITIAKQKTKDQFLVNILDEIKDMSQQTKVYGIYLYLKWCRQHHAEVLIDKKSKIKQGIQFIQRIKPNKKLESIGKKESKIFDQTSKKAT